MGNWDLARMRQMANDVRGDADALAGRAPIADGIRAQARKGLRDSNLAAKIEESLQALDTVVAYHADRLRDFSGAIDRTADEHEILEGHRAAQFNGLEAPR